MKAQLDSASRPSLSDQIHGAANQELVAMLLEGARKFTTQAAMAVLDRDQPGKERLVLRTSAIIEHLGIMLNHEEGGEVVDNLSRLYEWWLKEVLDASICDDADRLKRVASQMASMGEGWEQQRGVA